MNTTLDIPENLTGKGREAAETILAYLREREATYTGGCRTFYTPEEWAERGESYGRDSLLIVVYEGSDVAPFFSFDACYRTGAASDYEPCESMSAKLREVGCFPEQCTTWYTAIYPTRN